MKKQVHKKTSNSQYWTILLSSDTRSSMKQFRIRKKLFYAAGGLTIAIISMLFIGGFLIYGLQEERESLHQDISDIEHETEEKITRKDEQIEDLNRENEQVYEEAHQVRKAIEEFQLLEENLEDVNLELPSETSDEGSGGPSLELVSDKASAMTEKDIRDDLHVLQEQLPILIESFEETVDAIISYEEKMQAVPTIFPAAEGRISSQFGERSDPFTGQTSFHSGLDIAAPRGTEIYAAADGIVETVSKHSGYGNKIIIDHGNQYETLYAHLHTMDVEPGDKVEKGDVIGGMGTTGRSTGVHLHYEVFQHDAHVDPYPYITFHEQEEEN
ncbi:M23 family metallopeptidase [Salisediminibacterium beveridgei]|uniref:M23ase beta-sheet core domain-containing protein n=1 Tax=Salisediminibacterium beveridgei TaxID=632773 RepID=A0A1D7QWH3_9BACI|nr:M23 family metallopeptidase [Salisediminibacterium beveridgei]AOM83364.1 hypothetical protein BBEV_2004 [Salisediminibacterium beveridgei]